MSALAAMVANARVARKEGKTMQVCQLCADNAPREYRAGQWQHPLADGIAALRCGFQEQVGRAGDWMQTWSGRQFWARDCRPEDFHILDIAAGMRNPRYTNQCILTQTVGEHCVLLWRHAVAAGYPARLRRAVLLHDASEAYLVDLPRPIKRDLADYGEIEDRVMTAIAQRFAFDWPLPFEVKELDNRILNDEVAQNLAPPPAPWRQLAGGPLGVRIENWSPEVSFIRFLHACAVEGLI
jgi:hypothetical protein